MELDFEMINAYCDEALDLLSRWEIIGLELSKAKNEDHYQELFRIAHNMKGGSRAVGLTAYGDFIHKVEDGITLLRDCKVTYSQQVVNILLESQQILFEWTTMLKVEPEYKPDVNTFLAKFEAIFFGTEMDKNSDVIKIEEEKIMDVAATTLSASVPSPTVSSQQTLPNDKKKPTATNESIRIPAQKIDELIQVIGELSIHQSIVWHTRGNQNSHKMFLNSLHLGQKLTKELYDKALSLRMQPLQSVFQRLERNILDLSRSLNKLVVVDISGGDVELDKSVIERIIDPLTHVVRNAIDHGIETAEDRKIKGKNEQGNIRIFAKQDTFGVELVIKDDGKGLDSERILKKAIEKNLVNNSQNLSRKDIYNLIFLPGFSTAEKITDVSGRGVGMDVVRRTLEDLRGSIQIDSEFGHGTEFRITLPTSVSIIDAMLISVSEQNYVIPVGSIDEVIQFDEPLGTKTEMIHHGGAILPLVALEELLFTRNFNRNQKAQHKTILVCKGQNKKIGLSIDKVLGQQQIVIRPLNANIQGSFGLMGGTILGNGEPGLIIDIHALIHKYLQKTQSMELAA